MPGIGAAIAGGIASAGVAAASGIGNTLVNYGANKDLAHDARVFNSAEAQKQRDWEQYMASTQYQRMRADMEAAGINPASMSGVSGQPASVPSGASASSSAPSFSSNTFGGVSDIANSALKGVLAKDRQASRLLAREIRDNAIHGYRMEELQESMDQKKQNELFKSELSKNINSAKLGDRLIELDHKFENQMKYDIHKTWLEQTKNDKFYDADDYIEAKRNWKAKEFKERFGYYPEWFMKDVDDRVAAWKRRVAEKRKEKANNK